MLMLEGIFISYMCNLCQSSIKRNFIGLQSRLKRSNCANYVGVFEKFLNRLVIKNDDINFFLLIEEWLSVIYAETRYQGFYGWIVTASKLYQVATSTFTKFHSQNILQILLGKRYKIERNWSIFDHHKSFFFPQYSGSQLSLIKEHCGPSVIYFLDCCLNCLSIFSVLAIKVGKMMRLFRGKTYCSDIMG